MTDVEAIRARHRAASPGTWRVSPRPEGAMGIWVDDGESADLFLVYSTVIDDDPLPHRANADFVAHAHEDIPALLTEVDRLRALLLTVVSNNDRAAVDATNRALAAEAKLQLIDDLPLGHYISARDLAGDIRTILRSEPCES